MNPYLLREDVCIRISNYEMGSSGGNIFSARFSLTGSRWDPPLCLWRGIVWVNVTYSPLFFGFCR